MLLRSPRRTSFEKGPHDPPHRSHPLPKSLAADAITSIFADIEKLKSEVHGMLSFHVGTDVTPIPLSQGFTHAFTIDFADIAARDVYWDHPGHKAVATRLIPMLEKGAEDVLIFQLAFAAA